MSGSRRRRRYGDAVQGDAVEVAGAKSLCKSGS